MQLLGPQTLDISALRGALVANPNGAEFFVVGIGVDLANHLIMLELQSCDEPDMISGVDWTSLSDWSIQLRAHLRAPEG